MNKKALNAAMISGMVVVWAIYYATSKWAVGVTGSPFVAGFLLRAAALVFLTVQLAVQHKLGAVLRQGKTALILLSIGVFGYLLDTFANMGLQYGDVGAGTALLKSDVLMVNIATVVIYKKRLYISDWIGTLVMLVGVLLVRSVLYCQRCLRHDQCLYHQGCPGKVQGGYGHHRLLQ